MQIRMLRLQCLQLTHQRVILRVRNRRRIHHVIQVLVAPQLLPQRLHALPRLLVFCLLVHAQDSIGFPPPRISDCRLAVSLTCGSPRQRSATMEPSAYMEPVTHFLTGACIGRAGLNRKTAYATLAAVLAAEAADLDVLWSLAGPVESLKHHRGITHTFIAIPFVAAVITGAVWLYHLWGEKRRIRRAQM